MYLFSWNTDAGNCKSRKFTFERYHCKQKVGEVTWFFSLMLLLSEGDCPVVLIYNTQVRGHINFILIFLPTSPWCKIHLTTQRAWNLDIQVYSSLKLEKCPVKNLWHPPVMESHFSKFVRWRLLILPKLDSITGVFLKILQIFSEQLFYRTPMNTLVLKLYVMYLFISQL